MKLLHTRTSQSINKKLNERNVRFPFTNNFSLIFMGRAVNEKGPHFGSRVREMEFLSRDRGKNNFSAFLRLLAAEFCGSLDVREKSRIQIMAIEMCVWEKWLLDYLATKLWDQYPRSPYRLRIDAEAKGLTIPIKKCKVKQELKVV